MDEKNELQKEIESLIHSKSNLEAEINQINTNLGELNSTINTQTAIRDNLNSDVLNLTASRNNLNNEIATNTATRDNLQSEINNLTNSKNDLEAHLAGTTNSKQTLETEITQRNETITQLDLDIVNRTASRNSLNGEITTLTNTQTELSNNIAASTPIKQDLENEVGILRTNKLTLLADINTLQTEKKTWEENVRQWRDKYDLFSNDIAGISENNKKQRDKYAGGIVLTSLAAVVFMCFLVKSVSIGSDIPYGISLALKNNPTLLFFVYILMRVSIVGSLFVLIFVFINLLRGLVSQYIRTQEKMSAVRLIDYLVSKIGKETSGLTELQKIPFETTKMEKQNNLLSKHIPDLIEYNPSSFDKLSKTNNAGEILQDLINTGKLTIPK